MRSSIIIEVIESFNRDQGKETCCSRGDQEGDGDCRKE